MKGLGSSLLLIEKERKAYDTAYKSHLFTRPVKCTKLLSKLDTRTTKSL